MGFFDQTGERCADIWILVPEWNHRKCLSVYPASNTQEATGSPKVIHRTLITRAGDL